MEFHSDDLLYHETGVPIYKLAVTYLLEEIYSDSGKRIHNYL